MEDGRKIFKPLRTGKRGSEIGGLVKAASIAYRKPDHEFHFRELPTMVSSHLENV